MNMSAGHVVDWDDIEVCYVCNKNRDCSEGNNVATLDEEWVCDDCQKENKELTND